VIPWSSVFGQRRPGLKGSFFSFGFGPVSRDKLFRPRPPGSRAIRRFFGLIAALYFGRHASLYPPPRLWFFSFLPRSGRGYSPAPFLPAYFSKSGCGAPF